MIYRGKSSLFYILSSFVGALLVAASFAYNNYRFAKFKFIDFDNTTFYTQKDIFKPQKDYYYMLIFSSKMSNIDELLSQIPKNYPIIAIDMYGNKIDNQKALFLRAGTNTIISVIQKFNIYKVPVYFSIKRYHKNLFKQDSMKEHLKE